MSFPQHPPGDPRQRSAEPAEAPHPGTPAETAPQTATAPHPAAGDSAYGQQESAPGRGPVMQANQFQPYAPPVGHWEYVPTSPHDHGRQAQVAKSTELSLILGILGVALFPVLGPFALWQATKAERLGGRATVGKVLGWVGLIMLILGVLWVILMVMLWGFALAELSDAALSTSGSGRTLP